VLEVVAQRSLLSLRGAAIVRASDRHCPAATRHDEQVQSQGQRDDKTITIATALVIFVLVVAVGSVAGWAVNSAVDVAQVINRAFVILVWCAAGEIPVAYLVRTDRTRLPR
jgi:glycerol uptake facilitator-like aquaporin